MAAVVLTALVSGACPRTSSPRAPRMTSPRRCPGPVAPQPHRRRRHAAGRAGSGRLRRVDGAFAIRGDFATLMEVGSETYRSGPDVTERSSRPSWPQRSPRAASAIRASTFGRRTHYRGGGGGCAREPDHLLLLSPRQRWPGCAALRNVLLSAECSSRVGRDRRLLGGPASAPTRYARPAGRRREMSRGDLISACR